MKYFPLLFVTRTLASQALCKVTPHSSEWPSLTDWNELNNTISGRLLAPPPPAAVCHPDQPIFDSSSCNYVTSAWVNSTFHADNPISVDYNNWNNDTCLPDPSAPCSSIGYPIYVVNATGAQDVKVGIGFARTHNVRLIVKGSGHDYLGRYDPS